MKYKLLIQAEEFEEKQELIQMMNVHSYIRVLQEFDNYLRGRLKYEDLQADAAEALDLARSKLHELLGSDNINLWS